LDLLVKDKLGRNLNALAIFAEILFLVEAKIVIMVTILVV